MPVYATYALDEVADGLRALPGRRQAREDRPHSLGKTPPLCKAEGTKFNDLDADGKRDSGEPGLAGFRIWADYDNDGVLDAGEPYDDTDASGAYAITGINPRFTSAATRTFSTAKTYRLREKLASGTGHG